MSLQYRFTVSMLAGVIIFAVVMGLFYDSAFAVAPTKFRPEIGDEVLIAAKGIMKCETKGGEYCGAQETKTRLKLTITSISKDSMSGTGVARITVGTEADVLELRSNGLSWATFPQPNAMFPMCGGVYQINGKMTDDLGNAFTVEIAGHGILDKTCPVGTSMPTPYFLESTMKNSIGNVFSGYSVGDLSFKETADGETGH